MSIIMPAMLCKCNFQATLTKDAVIEYMTKYMTKSVQGSLVKIMEQSFSFAKFGVGIAFLALVSLWFVPDIAQNGPEIVSFLI